MFLRSSMKGPPLAFPPCRVELAELGPAGRAHRYRNRQSFRAGGQPALAVNPRWRSTRAGGSATLAPDQRVEAPVAAAVCRHEQKDEAEQDGGLAVVENGPGALGRVKLPVRDRHFA